MSAIMSFANENHNYYFLHFKQWIFRQVIYGNSMGYAPSLFCCGRIITTLTKLKWTLVINQIYVCIYACVYIYTHMYVCVCTYTHTYIHVYILAIVIKCRAKLQEQDFHIALSVEILTRCKAMSNNAIYWVRDCMKMML